LTNPWGGHKYVDNIEDREDGGTPGFLQVIKTALTIQLKEQMGIDNIMKREHEIVAYIFRIRAVSNIKILAQHQDRLGVISFYVDDLHFNLGVKLLNDKHKLAGAVVCCYGHFFFVTRRPRNVPN
jgi:selenocysteine lyase/cysteine desulfurase